MKKIQKTICILALAACTFLTACGSNNGNEEELLSGLLKKMAEQNEDGNDETSISEDASEGLTEVNLTGRQLYRLKGMLKFTSTLEDFDYQNADYSDMVCKVVQQTLLGNVMNVPFLYQETDKDPLGKWNGAEDSFMMVNKKDMDDYMQNYFHISGTVEESDSIYEYEDVYYVGYARHEDDYSYVKIKSIKQTEDGKYEINYDILKDAYETGELCYKLQEARIALADLESDNEWSCYYDRITNQADASVTYMEINPVQVNDGEWLYLEGVPELRGEQSVIMLPNQVQVCSEDGEQLAETNEITLTSDSIIDSSNYGTSVIVSGQIQYKDTGDESSVVMSNAIVSIIE